jgi:predicted DNA-binding protein (UPF0251 family)
MVQAPMSRRLRSDAFADALARPDEGCSLYPSCQTCPLPYCRYDSPNGVSLLRADWRALEVQRLRSQGATAPEISRRLGISIRTVWRLLKRPVSNVAMSRPQQISREGGARAV